MKDREKEELVAYRIKRANETLLEIDILLHNGLWNTAVNRLYYACYYSASALLYYYDFQTATHSGVRQMLGLHFIKTGKIDTELGKVFSELFDKRHSTDYDDFIELSREDVEDLLPKARLFVKAAENLILEKAANP